MNNYITFLPKDGILPSVAVHGQLIYDIDMNELKCFDHSTNSWTTIKVDDIPKSGVYNNSPIINLTENQLEYIAEKVQEQFMKKLTDDDSLKSVYQKLSNGVLESAENAINHFMYGMTTEESFINQLVEKANEKFKSDTELVVNKLFKKVDSELKLIKRDLEMNTIQSVLDRLSYLESIVSSQINK